MFIKNIKYEIMNISQAARYIGNIGTMVYV